MGVGVTHPCPTTTCGEPTPLPRIRSNPHTQISSTGKPPLPFPIRLPRGYIYFQKRYCERSYLRLNYMLASANFI